MKYPTISAKADIKTSAADFIVNEQLGFSLTGEGEHLWCYVEKTDMNTSYLERQWAKLVGCQRRDISHSGLKDRHALTRQWLCLPAIYGEQLPSEGVGWRIIERQRHRKKLRIGTHQSNAFVITMRNVVGDKAQIDAALNAIKAQGFLNTFGQQRFGQENLANAKQWVARKKLPKKREERAQVLSTLRAFLFNEQVAHRHALGLSDQLLLGDHVLLAGSHSHFMVTELDDTLTHRLQTGDITPAGLLVGQEKPKQMKAEQERAKQERADHKAPVQDHRDPPSDAERIRQQALAPYAELVAYLQTHCQADWRELTARASNFSWVWSSPQVLTLSFVLPKGSFATSLLGQVFTLTDQSKHQPADSV